MSKPVNEIIRFAHCASCAKMKPRQKSQAEWARLDVGLTKRGMQVWCRRCNLEVGHFTPDALREWLESAPGCDRCPGGKHAVPSD